ncbi:MAG: SRPBCC family protein [Bdellovibrionaceae bacterium]|nr:SRPBCC family protein [Pseudobdellovibrionaceae bacterium]
MALTTERKNVKTETKSVGSQKRVSGRHYQNDIGHFAVTIGKNRNDIFNFFRNFENLPFFMKDLKQVDILSNKKSHWIVELKNGLKAEWDAEIVAERPGEMIAWKSIEGSEVETTGSIWFSPAATGRGTIVSLLLDYKIPGGKLTEFVTKFTGEDPDSLAFINLRRLKGYLEVGEIATIDGQSSGRDLMKESTLKH